MIDTGLCLQCLESVSIGFKSYNRQNARIVEGLKSVPAFIHSSDVKRTTESRLEPMISINDFIVELYPSQYFQCKIVAVATSIYPPLAEPGWRPRFYSPRDPCLCWRGDARSDKTQACHCNIGRISTSIADRSAYLGPLLPHPSAWGRSR